MSQPIDNNIAADDRRPDTYIPSQMSEMLDALNDGRVQIMMRFGINMLSSFAEFHVRTSPAARYGCRAIL